MSVGQNMLQRDVAEPRVGSESFAIDKGAFLGLDENMNEIGRLLVPAP